MASTGDVVFAHGDVTIESTNEIQQMAIDMLDKLSPAVLQRFEDVTKEIADHAIENAPVKTGTYKKSIRRGLKISATTLEAFVVADPTRNGRSYAWAIRFEWPHNNKKVVNEHIFKPGKKAGKKLAIDLADDLLKLAGRGRV